MKTQCVPPNALADAIQHVRAGGRLCVRTATRATVINSITLARFEKAGEWLLREEGQGYRMRNGKGSVYLFPGQLEMITGD